jgi:hypothetical protein
MALRGYGGFGGAEDVQRIVFGDRSNVIVGLRSSIRMTSPMEDGRW